MERIASVAAIAVACASEPELMPANALPYADLARLAATHKLVPAGSMKGRYGPVDMEWDLRLGK